MRDIPLEDYKLWFETLMERTDDAFIIVDDKGIIQYINKKYCDFLFCKQNDAIGKPIIDLIPTTSMYDVMKKKLIKDKKIWLQPYIRSGDSLTLGNRFCFFDDKGNVIGAMAQCKFRDHTWTLADSLFKLEDSENTLGSIDPSSPGFDKIIGVDEEFLKLKTRAIRISKKDFPVFLGGETGTGKEVFAKAIHMASNRSTGPMISINCGAIPADLLESELFGYEEGAFTGARRGGKPGKFELANNGTIFFDEIADMPLNLQVKLLRVLQDFEIERVGGTESIPIDVRIISATRKDLEEMVENGQFREDLYYRLNVINLQIPPLRERKKDIPVFAKSFLKELNDKYDTKVVFSREAEKAFIQYSWPGNIRELKNVIAGAYASLEGLVLDAKDFPPKISGSSSFKIESEDESLNDAVKSYERFYIKECLEKHNYSMKDTAEALQIDRTALWRKLKSFGIEVKKTTD